MQSTIAHWRMSLRKVETRLFLFQTQGKRNGRGRLRQGRVSLCPVQDVKTGYLKIHGLKSLKCNTIAFLFRYLNDLTYQ